MPLYSLADVQTALVAEFPELAEDLREDAKLPFMQLGHVARFMQSAKGRADWDTYQRCADFGHRFFVGGNGELAGAISVAWLEHLDFAGDRGSEAWRRLSPELQRGWTSITESNARHAALPHKKRRR